MKYDDKPQGITISFGMAPPSGKKGKKKGTEAETRKRIAKDKVKKDLKKMYASWSPSRGNAESQAYNDELGAYIDSMEG